MLDAHTQDQITTLAAAGVSKAEIARRLRVDRKTARAVLARRGGPPRAPAAGPPAPGGAPTAHGVGAALARGDDRAPATDLATRAHRMLAAGARVTDLVCELGLTPAQARDAYEDWRACVLADESRPSIDQFVALRDEIRALGITVTQALGAVRLYEGLHAAVEEAGFAGTDGIELLRELHRRGMDSAEAGAVLGRLPALEEAERREVEAEARREEAEAWRDRAEVTRAHLEAEAADLAGHVGWLRLARDLAEATRSAGSVAALLRAALVRDEGRDGKELHRRATEAEEIAAEAAFAAWAARRLPNLLVLRGDHDEAVSTARARIQLRDVVAGMFLARSG